ncbi:MAG TPA: TolC family protein [Candidatus Angelobacter sp.]
MSAAFFRSDFIRKLISVVCLLTFPAAAQQSNSSVSLQPVAGPQTGSASTQQPAPSSPAQQPGASLPNAPEPRKLPPPTHVDYSKPVRLFPNPFARFIPRDVPPPVFTNAPRIAELVQNGKIMLSMNDAIALALVDNLDIAIARYNLPIADTDILLTKSGSGPRGVANGVVQNTPGGGVGGIGTTVTGAGAGGTSAGAGGAGAGVGGLVTNTSGAGPSAPSFDPVLTGTVSFERQQALQNFTLLAGGTPLASANTTIGDLAYSQGFSPGTSLSVGFNNSRVTTNNPGVRFNPSITSNFTARITQHLLQGFGPSLNTRLIRQAKNSKKITEEAFRLQVISTVSQIENIYWNLVNAFEDLKVKERSLALAQKTLSDNQKQVEIGTLAPLDVVRAESTVASAEQDLIVSKTNLELQQLTIKNALTRSLPNNSQVMQMDVIPTDTVQIPDQENLPPVEEMIRMALLNRPDYNTQKINLMNSEITIQGANAGLLPILDVTAFYGGSGLNGVQNLGQPLCPPGVLPSTANPCQLSSGFGDSFGNLFNGTAPDRGIVFSLQIPLANRAAQATQIRSRLEYRQSQLLLRQQENKIAIAIRNDAFTLEQARARVVAAQKAQDLAQKTLDAEQKKYNLGASTYLNILTDDSALASAESSVVSAMTNYAEARVLLDQDLAQTLDRNNIKLDEVVTGEVKTIPNVPGTVVNKNALEELTTPPQPQQPNPPPKP